MPINMFVESVLDSEARIQSLAYLSLVLFIVTVSILRVVPI